MLHAQTRTHKFLQGGCWPTQAVVPGVISIQLGFVQFSPTGVKHLQAFTHTWQCAHYASVCRACFSTEPAECHGVNESVRGVQAPGSLAHCCTPCICGYEYAAASAMHILTQARSNAVAAHEACLASSQNISWHSTVCIRHCCSMSHTMRTLLVPRMWLKSMNYSRLQMLPCSRL